MIAIGFSAGDHNLAMGNEAVTLDVTGDNSTSTSVNLAKQGLAITGSNGITTAASNQGVTVSLDTDAINNMISNNATVQDNTDNIAKNADNIAKNAQLEAKNASLEADVETLKAQVAALLAR